MAEHRKSAGRALPDQVAIGVHEVNGTGTVRDALAAVFQKSSRILQRPVERFHKFTKLRRYLRTRRAILSGEKLFDLSTAETQARGLMGPFALNLYKIALATLPAIATAWFLSWRQQLAFSFHTGHDLWDGLLFQGQAIRAMIPHRAIALVVPIVALMVAVGASACCLDSFDSKRGTRWRCRRAFLYFDAAYGLFPQMVFSIVLVLFANQDWVSEQIGEDTFYAFNFLLGLPLAAAAIWPGYALWVQVPRLLFEVNGYGEPEGIMSTSAPHPYPWKRFLGGAAITVLAVVPLIRLALPKYVVYFPQPSGPFAVGRIAYDWIDLSRAEFVSPGVHSNAREIKVYIWYPAAQTKPGAPTAPYFPDVEKMDKSTLAEVEKKNWGSAWPIIVSGDVHTRAYENAPIARGGGLFPLIVFSPGNNVGPFGYTHQIEELVSRGYVVAAIDRIHDVVPRSFPDGMTIPWTGYPREKLTSELLSEENEWVDIWATDIRFVVDQIARLNMTTEQKSPFAGRIDLGRVGVFGHSFGGVAAARACQVDQRIRACLNQEGVVADGPILRDNEKHMPAQAFLFLRAFLEPATEVDLEFERAIENELQHCSGSTYQVWIPGYGHADFTDRSLLQAAGNPRSAWQALKSQRLVDLYTVAFFDKFLSGAHDTLLDHAPSRDSEVYIERYSR